MRSTLLSKRFAVFYVMGFVVLLLNGCAKTTQFDDVWESSLKGCSTNCHSPGGTESSGPDMSTEDKFYDNVVGKSAADDFPNWTLASDCGDSLLMIKPGDAANSSLVAALVQSVSDAQACDSAFNTHVTANVTSSENAWTDLVKWINDGAKKE